MKIYTLQIALNQYHPESPVSSLSGCENDIQNLTSYLESRFSKDQLSSCALINETATYENIIKHFGEVHLLKAKKGDIVLIQYSGHGAREMAAPQFAAYAPEGKQETWICYDSRLPGHYDLSDKELAVLIARIATKGIQVILLFDCCHAGSGTRSLNSQLSKARQWDDRKDVRPLETYLDGYFINNAHLPVAQHLLLAACEKREKAYELISNEGSFTSHLLSILKSQKGPISYAQLFAQTKMLMQRISANQTPQLEPEGFFNVHTDFLSFDSETRQQAYSCYFKKGQWMVGAGAIKGLPTTPGEKAQFGIYEGDTLIGNAESQSVFTDTCVIKPLVNLDENGKYQARIFSLADSRISVSFQADKLGKIYLKEALKEYTPVYFQLVENDLHGLYQLQISYDELIIIRQADQLMIRTKLGHDKPSFIDIFKHLEHICSWEKMHQLENKSARDKGDVKIILTEMGATGNEIRKTSDQEVMIDILQYDGQEQKVPFRVELYNQVDKPFYCALFYLSGNFGVYRVYNEELPGRSSAIVMERSANGAPLAFVLYGKNESTDVFKLIVSQEKINDVILTQESFKLGEQITSGKSIADLNDEFEQTAFNKWFTVTMNCKSIARLY